MDAQQLIAQMRQQRRRWVEVAAGKRVQIRMPTDLEVIRHFLGDDGNGGRALRAEVDQVREFVEGWEGFTEADLLGAAIGSDAPAPFTRELWDAVLQDQVAWIRTVAEALLQAIVERQKAREADAKN